MSYARQVSACRSLTLTNKGTKAPFTLHRILSSRRAAPRRGMLSYEAIAYTILDSYKKCPETPQKIA